MNELSPGGILLSLIIPVYNSERFIEENLLRASQFLARLEQPCELLVVNDASMDRTARILEDAARRIEGVKVQVIHNRINRGKGYSVRKGMEAAGGRFLVFNDADFTYPIEEVSSFLTLLQNGADLVIGCRVHPESRYIVESGFFPSIYTRHAMGRLFNIIANLILGLKLRDTQAGIKGFNQQAVKTIFSRQSLNRFSFDLELLFIARKQGMKITEAPVCFLYRKEPSTLKFFSDSIKILVDMVKIRWWSFKRRYD